MTASDSFRDRGWCRFAYDPVLADWARAALPYARTAVRAPDNARWWRHRNTWFVGVNVLPNDEAGSVGGGPALAGRAVDFIRTDLGFDDLEWDRAQISVCLPGYPQRDDSESEAAHIYRRRRDAAHVDGLRAEGADRRRHLMELHRFILGIPLVECAAGAAPFVVWERSHEIMGAAFATRYRGEPPQCWREIDVTEPYHRARREVLAHCRRTEVPAAPGEAFLVHRHAVHGTAPWAADASAGPDGRMIAFFRPVTPDARWWLAAV